MEYQLFYRDQPFGLWREDYRTAQIAHILAMVNSDPNKKLPEIVDFMPFYKDKVAQVEDDEDDGSERYLANR